MWIEHKLASYIDNGDIQVDICDRLVFDGGATGWIK